MKCSVCGRKLRSPESVAVGMGPKCAGKSSGGGGGYRYKEIQNSLQATLGTEIEEETEVEVETNT